MNKTQIKKPATTSIKSNVNDPNPIEFYSYIQDGIEIWVENKKGKNDGKEEPYFKVRKKLFLKKI